MNHQPPAPLTPLGARTPLAHPALYAIIAILSLIIIAGATWVFWPRETGTPSPSASPSATPSPVAQSSPLDCTIFGAPPNGTTPFEQRYEWFPAFRKQMLPGWELDSVCYNQNTNQAVYLKHRQPTDKRIPEAQLGVYSIALDTFDKGPIFNVDILFGGCGFSEDLLPSWEGDSITFGCRGGDAGYGRQTTHAFNIRTREQRLVHSCEISEDAPPCVTKDERVGSMTPWKESTVAGVSFTQPADWPQPSMGPYGNFPLQYIVDEEPLFFGPIGPLGPYLEGSIDSPYHLAVYGPLSYDLLLSEVRKREYPLGDHMNIRTGVLNGMPTISYDVGGLCGGPEAILFGVRKTVVISSYCVDEAKDLFDSIVPTIRIP